MSTGGLAQPDVSLLSYHSSYLTFLPLLFLPLDDDGLLVLPGPLYFRLRRSLRLADLTGIDLMP